ncbi:HlyC/CorC family transporter [Solemya velum gill symbiont]|uniref:Magnesium and cobalt efflux protein CorC n=1 Tax=Solemya velum gill symbiont TaxID=2340 RepID=A0A0B0H896_SOVGS|nr:transporter associated domain-containing protein [Solemya velum gill symbiont]KHF26363.1 Mg2+ and Co2+ transporter CorC [Solemya velum gill symbiont]OOY35550.1 magnesium/cobalt efflux protein [Solemya velum gill symbiont]OOY38493.1 magnesium/cobalt efflux protein [Solemya velum gill symbiont]OOY40447.1 magnesium/cobalt efflux protein [Solemya velum gill symbiont]OOY45112.1 magnesium/cobalt efflux protein [Solemya velum gill symbiont]
MKNEEPPSSSGSLRSWLKNLFQPRGSEPQNRDQLVALIREANRSAILDADGQAMIEGVLSVSDLRVRDIMLPRADVVMVGRDDRLEDVLPVVIESAHSRFPVIGDDRGEVVGIILAKDLLQYCGDNGDKFRMRDVLRSAVFVPESKRLNVLLKEFRTSRNHMAVVIDEYGAAAGMVTIEDVLEQIVGEIEDEHDFDEGAMIMQRSEYEYTTKAHLDIEDFNHYFDASLSDDEFDTIGGLVTHTLGHLPKRGESVTIDRFEFRVIRADSRRIRLLSIHLPDNTPES